MADFPLDFSVQLLAIAVGIALFVATAIGFALQGPVRWVKITTALLVADFLVMRALYAGWQVGLVTAGLLVGSIFVTVAFAFLTWRHPITKVLSPATPADCPRHARKALEKWTRELVELGFGVHAELRTVWRLNGEDRITYVRFLTHHSEPLWIELHALHDPKVAARMAMSDKGDGRAVLTCDKQADQELFEDPLTTVQRLPSAVSCADLVDAHRKLAMTSEGRLARVEDPARAHVELYGGWVERLLASGQVRRCEEQQIGLQPASIPGLVLKTWAAWFH